MAVRSPEKGASVAQQLRREFPGAVVDVYPLEMGSYESVTGLAGRLAAEFAPGSNNKRLDIAILNAGIVMPDFVRNKSTGHCEVIQVNYLSTVLLAILLLPVVSSPPGGKTSPGRLSIVGSGTALAAKIPNRDVRPFLASFDSPEKLKWDATERYFSSKALMHLFLVKLLDYLGDDKYGSDRVVVNIVDPGYTKGSGLHREAEGLLSAFLTASKELTGRTLDHAAWSYVDAVVRKGPESHGCFVMDGEIRPCVSFFFFFVSCGVMTATNV
ncbi:hypothetical protein QBC47DRAFT_383958 [Echria macrotheca]|uniref:Uncharacterized protein n=1 Tax=Echria macrotheca TaxID=438768 RepID=A0AAJ0BAV3_9PEZI|nr:hypothetical protein QBC47DRAFT_383958 [Echria macrotheca]